MTRIIDADKLIRMNDADNGRAKLARTTNLTRTVRTDGHRQTTRIIGADGRRGGLLRMIDAET